MTYINDQIRASKVIIIDDSWANLGTFPRDVALSMAQSQWMDLVQMSYNPKEFISTAKICDYGKYMYDKQKDQKEKKKSQKMKGMKELSFRYTIGENDLNLKIKKAKELLGEWYSLRFVVKLRGREKIYSDKAYEKMKRIEQELVSESRTQGIKTEPNWYSMALMSKGNK